MKNNLKNSIVSVLMFFLLTVVPTTSFSGPVNAPVETGEGFSIYIQKVAKTALFIENILESVTYVLSVGKEGINAAVESLSGLAGNLGPFQETLRFADSSSFSILLGDGSDFLTSNAVTSQIADTERKLDNVAEKVDTIEASVSQTKEKLENSTNKLLNTAGEKVRDVVNKASTLDTFSKEKVQDISDSKSAYARVGTVQGSYGASQESKQAAEQYIRKMFFYSTKDGDKYDGEELTEIDKALEAVKENRKGYLLEVISTAYATAVENRTSVYEDAIKRYNQIKSQASSADTVDAKKAAETLIVQEETRQRINRLSLELSILEQDVIGDLFEEPANILIARTVEQIQSETETEVEDVDFNGNSDFAK